MNHQVKILLGCVGALAVVSAAVVLAFLAPAKEESSNAAESFTLMQGKVSSVSVTNGKGNLRVSREGDVFTVDGLEGFQLSDNPSVLLTQAEGLEAMREITPAEDLKQFGLDAPQETAEIVADGNVRKLQLGSEAASSSGRYVLLDGKVYIVTSALDAFAYGKEDCVSLQVTQPLDAEDVVSSVELQRGDSVLKLSYVPETSVQQSSSESSSQEDVQTIPAYYQLTSPVSAEIKSYDVTSWAGSAFGLSAQSVAAVTADEQLLEQLGLAQPETVLKVTSQEGKSVELLTSPVINGSYYLMRRDGGAVYQFGAAEIPWGTVTLETLTKSIFGGVDPEMVREILIESGEKTYRLVNENGKYTLNEKEISSEASTSILDSVLNIVPQAVTDAQPTLEPVAVVTVTYTQGRETDVVRMIPTGTGNVYLERNGQIAYSATESSATGMLQACESAAASS